MFKSEVVANVFWCSSRMDPCTTYWEYKCSSVDTALYTDAWGIKHNCGKKNIRVRQGSVKERWFSTHSTQGSHPVHFCQCCPVEKQLSWTFLKKFEKHSNKTSKEMFSSSTLLYIYIYIF